MKTIIEFNTRKILVDDERTLEIVVRAISSISFKSKAIEYDYGTGHYKIIGEPYIEIKIVPDDQIVEKEVFGDED